MITPREFIQQWTEPLNKLDPLFLQQPNIDLPPESLTFLVDAGLPRECAPFLSFGDVGTGLNYVYDVFGVHLDRLTPQEKARLFHYRMIGTEGEGNPICLVTGHSGGVAILDHSDYFRVLWFVNSSVPQLAECLLAYRRMIEVSQHENGKDAFLDGNVPAYAKQDAVTAILHADPAALNEDCFWRLEIDRLGEHL